MKHKLQQQENLTPTIINSNSHSNNNNSLKKKWMQAVMLSKWSLKNKLSNSLPQLFGNNNNNDKNNNNKATTTTCSNTNDSNNSSNPTSPTTLMQEEGNNNQTVMNDIPPKINEKKKMKRSSASFEIKHHHLTNGSTIQDDKENQKPSTTNAQEKALPELFQKLNIQSTSPNSLTSGTSAWIPNGNKNQMINEMNSNQQQGNMNVDPSLSNLFIKLLSLETPTLNKKMTNLFYQNDLNLIQFFKVITNPLGLGISKKDSLDFGKKFVNLIVNASGSFENVINLNYSALTKELIITLSLNENEHFYHSKFIIEVLKKFIENYNIRVYNTIRRNNLLPYLFLNNEVLFFVLNNLLTDTYLNSNKNFNEDSIKFLDYCANEWSNCLQNYNSSEFKELFEYCLSLVVEYNYKSLFIKMKDNLLNKLLDKWYNCVNVENLQLLNHLIRTTSNSSVTTVSDFHFQLLKTLMEKYFITMIQLLQKDDLNNNCEIKLNAYTIRNRFGAFRLELIYLLTYITHFSYIDCIDKSIFRMYKKESIQMIEILTKLFFEYSHCNLLHNIYTILFMEVIFRNENNAMKSFLNEFYKTAILQFQKKNEIDNFGHILQLLNMIRLSLKCSPPDTFIYKFLCEEHLNEWKVVEGLIIRETLRMEGLKEELDIDVGSEYAEHFGFTVNDLYIPEENSMMMEEETSLLED
ncbi:hypothetical protein ABK040_002340 [Willaertia magna]